MQYVNALLLTTSKLVKWLIHRARNFKCIFSEVYFCNNWFHANISTLKNIKEIPETRGNQRTIVKFDKIKI